MANPPNDGGGFPADRYTNPEAALGGADSVEKTSYVTGKGTEPEDRSPSGERKGGGQRAPNTALLIIGALLLLAVIVYMLPGLR